MMQPGPKNLITDVQGLLVGNAQDGSIKTGVTVLTADQPLVTSYCVMGGAPGTRDTDLLAPDKTVKSVDALVLSGGSAFGLDAASGVVDKLKESGKGLEVAGHIVPLVPAAILFDLSNGGKKDWSNNPYPNLGKQAYENLNPEFELGSFGAGCGAQGGTMKGGLGSASFKLSNGITVGALVAANPAGDATDETGRHFWAAPFEVGNEFGAFGAPSGGSYAKSFERSEFFPLEDRANTTIGIIATDADLTKAQAQRLATSAHDGIARAIVPSHLPYDGDLIFACSAKKIPLRDEIYDLAKICHAASLCMARAIARGFYNAENLPGDPMPTYKNFNS
jgi:D-aminopeptidase